MKRNSRRMTSQSKSSCGVALSLSLTLLCFASLPLGDLSAERLRAIAALSPLPRCSSGPRLLVLVQCSTEPIYLTQRAIWRLMARSHSCVHVVFLWDAADSSAGAGALAAGAPRLVGADLFVPNAAGLTPGVHRKIIAGLREYAADLAPGDARGDPLSLDASFRNDGAVRSNAFRGFTPRSRFDFVLRTNLSSFWVWARFLLWIAASGMPRSGAYAGVVYSVPEAPVFTSGAGTLMSADVALLLLRHNNSLDFTLYDDVAIGKLMAELGVKALPMTRKDYVDECLDLPMQLDDGSAYHFRVKCHNRVRDDASAFARLYAEIYGEGEM